MACAAAETVRSGVVNGAAGAAAGDGDTGTVAVHAAQGGGVAGQQRAGASGFSQGDDGRRRHLDGTGAATIALVVGRIGAAVRHRGAACDGQIEQTAVGRGNQGFLSVTDTSSSVMDKVTMPMVVLPQATVEPSRYEALAPGSLSVMITVLVPSGTESLTRVMAVPAP